MNNSYPNAAKGITWLFYAEILALVSIPLAAILIGGITGIVAAVLELVALYTAANDDQGYRNAFYAAIASLVVAVIHGFASEGILGGLLTAVSSVIGLLIVYQVCTTTNLLLGDGELVSRGELVIKIYLACTVVSAVCSVLSIIPVLGAIAFVVEVVAGIASIVGYVLFLMYLWGAGKALA